MRKKGCLVAHWRVWPTEGFTLLACVDLMV